MQLEERLKQLESDLLADPPRISAYSELPCALFRYEPHDEWLFRRELKKLTTRIEGRGKAVSLLSLATVLWDAFEKAEGLAPVVALEKESGWEAAQEQIQVYLSDPDFSHLPTVLADKIAQLDPGTEFVFLWRAAVLSPGFYLLSKLLDELKGKLSITTVLFYPGTLENNDLRFMGLRGRESMSNYRVKIY